MTDDGGAESESAAMAEVLGLVLEGTGYDFRDYQPAFLTRRLRRVSASLRLGGDLVPLAELARADGAVSAQVIEALGIGVTQMFRDPGFFRSLREHVIGELRTHPLARVWVAGCATGEEAYSLAILLDEEGLGDRYRIYATDINVRSLGVAKSGIVDSSRMEQNTRNYRAAGGKLDFGEYFETTHGETTIRQTWQRKIVFARHNLGTEPGFNTFNLITCRNVLIYFNRGLHTRVHSEFYDSLTTGGYLGLGARESLRSSDFADRFRCVDREARLYRKFR